MNIIPFPTQPQRNERLESELKPFVFASFKVALIAYATYIETMLANGGLDEHFEPPWDLIAVQLHAQFKATYPMLSGELLNGLVGLTAAYAKLCFDTDTNRTLYQELSSNESPKTDTDLVKVYQQFIKSNSEI
jgi:hypothetical protein